MPLKVSEECTKRSVVTVALQACIARREQRCVVERLGKLVCSDAFDCKTERPRL